MVTATGAISQMLRRPTGYAGLWGWVTTVDHKRIGVLYGVTAILFILVGGIEAMIIRLQLAQPDSTLVAADTFNQLFTMHALTMIFLGVMPLGGAFFNFVVPLQIGARDVAFPRLNAFSYWAYLFGGILLTVSFLFGGAPDVGWFAYSNLTSTEFSPGSGVDFYIVGLQVLGISSMAAAFNFIVTIINMRAPGMTLMRMPVFVWMTLITSILLVLAFPVLTVGLIELMFGRFFGMPFFNPAQGGDPLLWQHLFWVFGHPEVYILILPAMGIVSEVLPTFSRKPLFGYAVIVFSGIAIAFMGFTVWAHHMFTVGLGPIALSAFSGATMLIAVPTGVKIFNWMATLWGGSIVFKTPLYYAIGFVMLFTIGGLSGVMHASPPVDTQQQDTYFIVAHLHYVLFGGSIMGLMAGIFFWYPKVTGRMLSESLGKIQFWLMFLGMNLTFGLMHIVGLQGMPRRIYTYSDNMGWSALNLAETVGVFMMLAGGLLFLHNVFRSLRHGQIAGNDPWDARTLEWTIPSPPPVYNFEKIPYVASREQFWESKYPDGNNSEMVKPITGAVDGETDSHEKIHMPSPSYWPLVVAFGLTLGAGFTLLHPALGSIGVVVMLIGIYAWSFEPAAAEEH